MSSSRAGGVAQAPHALALRGGGRLPSFAVNLLVEQLASQEAWVKVIKALTVIFLVTQRVSTSFVGLGPKLGVLYIGN